MDIKHSAIDMTVSYMLHRIYLLHKSLQPETRNLAIAYRSHSASHSSHFWRIQH